MTRPPSSVRGRDLLTCSPSNRARPSDRPKCNACQTHDAQRKDRRDRSLCGLAVGAACKQADSRARASQSAGGEGIKQDQNGLISPINQTEMCAVPENFACPFPRSALNIPRLLRKGPLIINVVQAPAVLALRSYPVAAPWDIQGVGLLSANF